MSIIIPMPYDITGVDRIILKSTNGISAQLTKQVYRVILETDEDNRVVAKCIDFKGVVTDGVNEDEAIKNMYEALDAFLEAQGINKEFNLIVE